MGLLRGFSVDPARMVFEEIRLWEPSPAPVEIETIVSDMEGRDRDFVRAAYYMAQRLYANLPPRKNNQSAFTHPTNVALFLLKAKAQPHVVAAGILHDVLEEKMDIEMRGVKATGAELERLERAVRGSIAREVVEAAAKTGFPREIAERVVEIVWTLTRHKTHLYYRSISGIFNHPDPSIRVTAALVKLADRMHNVQTIENYSEEEQIYQCFKNIFILNNAKELRKEVQAKHVDPRMLQSLEKLFKKCGKATFCGLTRIECQYYCEHSRLFSALIMLQLALRKFIHEVKGLWAVTEAELRAGAPVYYIYHGIVKKYDHRLHHEDRAFWQQAEKEIDYLAATFADLQLTEDELREAIRYKDAIALKEVVASLLYLDQYIIRGFHCSSLCTRGRDCVKRVSAGDE